VSERNQQYERVLMLREAGWGIRPIARETGVPATTVYRWVDPLFAERDRARARAWKARHRRTCPSCGGDMTADTRAKTCRACDPTNQPRTRCKNGHPLTPETTYICNGGTARRCKECTRAYHREWLQRRRGAA
jgi:hypothetical protein